MKSRNLLLSFAFVLCFSNTDAQRLNLFTSETDKIWNNGVAERVPYKETTGYFDYMPGDAKPDTIVDGKPSYFIYFMIPYDVNEIGVRFITPVPTYAFAETGDIVTESFEANKNDKRFFDPYIELEQWMDHSSDSATQFVPHWHVLSKNDDSDEVMAQPSGKLSNALLRVYTGPYSPGTYRLCFFAAKNSTMQGTFLVHLGTIPGIRRIKAGRSVKELEIER